MLEALFERARNDQRGAFIPYVMAGDPDLETTEAILDVLKELHVDAIELGIPYGDPLADGPIIAAAGARALAAGVRIADVLALVRRYRDRGGVPIVLFTYFNPVYKYGVERFAREAADAGACAVIVPDIALEEGGELSRALVECSLDMPLLVAPSTTPERARKIVERSTGFIYVVSRLGVTGVGEAPNLDPLHQQVSMLRALTDKPLAIGFGISAPAHVRAVVPLADGVIIGSALIDAYAGTRGAQAADRVRAFVQPLLAATRFASASRFAFDT